jgi:DNA-binding transcriptional MerR regulator
VVDSDYHLTVSEVAIILDLDPSTVRRYSAPEPVRPGELRTTVNPSNGYRLYSAADVEAYRKSEWYRTLRARADERRARRPRLGA